MPKPAEPPATQPAADAHAHAMPKPAEPPATQPAADAHALPPAQVADRLGADLDRGLDPADAARRLAEHGPNRLTAQRGRGPLMRLLLQFHQPLVYILLAACAVTVAIGEWVDAGVIFGVVLVNAILGFVQETKAVAALESLGRTMEAVATVVRGGQPAHRPATGLVPGDVVLLEAGDKVPADLRLVRVRDLEVDEAPLTGESVPSPKSVDPVAADVVLADRVSMAYASTMVTRGQARGLVVATGDATEVGRISRLIATAEDLDTPLTRKIARFSRLLLVAILALAAVTFALGLLQGRSALETFMAAVALMVGAIPEGLPAAMTIMLALGVSRMARRRAIIRKLPAVETLGSTTVICSDKTGTLTQNRMTLVRGQAAGRAFEPAGALDEAARECLVAGALCNDSRLVREDGDLRVEGDPTEGALLLAAEEAGLSPAALSTEHPRLDGVPFESERQYMATLHDVGGARRVYLKGSVEAIAARCEARVGPSGVEPIAPDEVHAQADALAAQGLRVLALARLDLPPGADGISHDDLVGGATLLGLVGLLDPPRPEAREAIAMCQAAGVAVKMITGDHAVTATRIAEALGIEGARDGEHLEALRGADLDRLSEGALADAAERVAVFARVSPEQKLRLVKALQSRGHVAAMTGDGVNDAPALRQADIGVAMGRGGTDVARDASDMVLTDDNFASIEAAVEEGRGVFDNLTKFIVWTLPTNLGEALIVLASMVFATTLPILPVQILWVNMTTAVLLGLTLAFEPNEPGIMDRPPRPAGEPILTHPLIMRTLFVGTLLLVAGYGLFEWSIARGLDDAAARTVTVNAIVVGELFYLFNCRSLIRPARHVGWWSNPWVYAGSAAMLAAQAAFTYLPIFNTLFDTAPIGGSEWAQVAGAGAAIFVLVHTEKRVRLWRESRAAHTA